MTEHKRNLTNHDESIRKMREDINENKHMMSANQDLINKISSKLERARETLQSEINGRCDDCMTKIEAIDKFYIDYMSNIDNKI